MNDGMSDRIVVVVLGLALVALTLVDARPAAAQNTTARTCITTIETNIGSVRVLRKIGPKQNCPAGEELYTWERTGFAWMDEWSSSTTYKINDAVSLAGSSYLSLIDGNVNQDPETSPAAWGVLALAGGGGGGDLTLLVGGTFSDITAGFTDLYSGPAVGLALSPLEAAVPLPAGTLQNLRVHTGNPNLDSAALVVTVNINGVDQAMTCTATGAGSSTGNGCEDTSTTLAVAAGDLLAFHLRFTGSGASTRMTYSIELVTNVAP